MNETFDDPITTTDRQDNFGGREVGLTHPDAPGFIRLRDNGDIEVIAGEGLAILLHPNNGSITFVADHINFMTREEGGLRWNHSAFNSKATSFNEPALIAKDDTTEDAYGLFEGVEVYMKGIDGQKRVPWVTDALGNKMSLEEYLELMKKDSTPEDPNRNLKFEDLPPGTFSE